MVPGNAGAVPGVLDYAAGAERALGLGWCPRSLQQFLPSFLFGGWGPLRINQQRRVPVFSSHDHWRFERYMSDTDIFFHRCIVTYGRAFISQAFLNFCLDAPPPNSTFLSFERCPTRPKGSCFNSPTREARRGKAQALSNSWSA